MKYRPALPFGLGMACAAAVAGHLLLVAVFASGVGAGRVEPPAPASRPERSGPMVTRLLTAPVIATVPADGSLPRARSTTHGASETAYKPAPPVRLSKSQPVAVDSIGPEAPEAQQIALAPSFWPTNELDIPPLPRSEPDATRLQGVLASGLPIRLRLYIDAVGSVENVEVLQASEQDADVVKRMKTMFYETQFLAAKRSGMDVASYMDIDVDTTQLQ